MQQVIKRRHVSAIDDFLELMSKDGYTVKQISGTGDEDYVWILFEKTSNTDTETSL